MTTTALQKGLDASRYALDNGTVVIAKEARTIPAVTIQVGVKAGSIYDSNALVGLSHLTSRVLDRGTHDVAVSAIVHAGIARDADDRGVVGDELLLAEARERWQDLPPREVAGSAEHDERAWPVHQPLMDTLLAFARVCLDPVPPARLRCH
jgi:hypothetical protein